MSDPVSDLRAAVEAAATALRGSEPSEAPILERPPKPEFGDYSTNAAMLAAPALGEPPRQVAERLGEELVGRLGSALERVEVAGPGFLNLYMSDSWCARSLAGALEQGEAYGARDRSSGERANVEFVSANPTGPVTVASGRHAAYGDALCRILAFVGHEVEAEYYVNDRGGQIERFGASIAASISGADPPEDGYEGGYVASLGERIAAEGIDPADTEALQRRGVELMLEEIRATLHRYGVDFDDWFSERSLHDRGEVSATLQRLRESGHAYESEGALWLRSTDFGDDKDRVLVRADGEPTYLASDAAYHADKLGRGFEHLINVLGADHHGYVTRVRAALAALGLDAEALEATIMQLVHIVERGERAQMSKRRGDFVSLDELVADIGVDATRFFMLQRSHDTTLDLDLDLARRQSNENPVYYVQYAHARIASILRKAGLDPSEGPPPALDGTDVAALEPAEKALIKRLLELPEEVAEAAERLAPHRICAYSQAVAADFHGFYRDCQVVGAEGAGVEEARLALCVVTKRTIATALGLLGISAPERM